MLCRLFCPEGAISLQKFTNLLAGQDRPFPAPAGKKLLPAPGSPQEKQRPALAADARDTADTQQAASSGSSPKGQRQRDRGFFSPNSTNTKSRFPAFEAKTVQRSEQSAPVETGEACSRDNESLLSYSFQPNERRQRHFARCPDSALRRAPVPRLEQTGGGEARRGAFSAEVADAWPGEPAETAPRCPVWEQGRQRVEGSEGAGLHYPLSEKFLGLNTPGRSEARQLFDVKANVKLWPDVKSSRPSDPHAGLLGRLASLSGPAGSPRRGAVELCGAPALLRAAEKGHCSDALAKKAVLDRAEAVLESRRRAGLVACTAFAKLRVKLRELFEMLKPTASSQYIYRDQLFDFLARLDIFPLEAAKDSCFRVLDPDRDGLVSFSDFEKLFRLHENNLREIPRTKAGTQAPRRFEDLEEDFREEFGLLLALSVQLGERLRLFRLSVAEAFGSVRGLSRPELRARVQSVFTASRTAQNEELAYLVEQLYSV